MSINMLQVRVVLSLSFDLAFYVSYLCEFACRAISNGVLPVPRRAAKW